MKEGDIIKGYKVLQDFAIAGAGFSKWTFAKKGGKEFFIKEFLSPTYPVEGSPGGTEIKKRKKEQCRIFENHHKNLMGVLADRCAEGGNLVVTKAFFRNESKYYKVTDKVDVASLRVEDIAKQSIDKRVLILRTVAHSLRILHRENIVHGDLKPTNILIKETETGHLTTKLIDFDNSFFSGSPPSNLEEVVGDMVYYSPELGRYVQGDTDIEPNDLQLNSDIFALGLIYCQYLIGQMPEFDLEKYKYPYVAVYDGFELTVKDKDLPPRLASVLDTMLLMDPTSRPDIQTVFTQLQRKDLLDPESPEPVTPVSSGGRLKGTLIGSIPEKVPKPIIPTGSRLKGKLAKS